MYGLKKFACFIIAIVLLLSLISVFPVAFQANTYTYETVLADSLNVRSMPRLDASIVGKLSLGDEVKIVKTANDWSKITYNSMTGWVSNKYLQQIGKTGVILADSLNVRSDASILSDTIGSLKKGTSVTILREQYGWYLIQSENMKGWVSQVYVDLDSTNTVQSTATFYVKATSLCVRSEPSVTATVLGNYQSNDTVSVLAEQNGWSKIQYKDGIGWVASQYLSDTKLGTGISQKIKLTSNANLRSGPGTDYSLISSANAGTQFMQVDQEGDWLQIELSDGSTAWVASWLTTTKTSTTSSSGIKGKTIVLDAGHGGRDSGAIGSLYQEKDLTLSTVLMVADLLKQAGANVVLTRDSDTYVTLSNRVKISHSTNADAFISFHYNSGTSASNGIMTFYYTEMKDEELAQSIQSELASSSGLKDQGIRYGDYQVIRENHNPAVLLELGFLSNPSEEKIIGTTYQQQKVAKAITKGIVQYFTR